VLEAMKCAVLLALAAASCSPCLSLEVAPPHHDKMALLSLNATRKQPKSTHVAPMPTTGHLKEAGGGYMPGSPLYAKQEKRAPAPTTAPAIIPPIDATGVGTTPLARIKQWLMTEIASIFLLFLFACIYRKTKTDGPKDGTAHSNSSGFTYGLFEVGGFESDNCKICCSAFCCPYIRWAETLNSFKGGMQFWLAFWILMFLHLISIPTAGIAFLLTVFMGVRYRQRLRDAYGHENTKVNVAWDFGAWCCCPCCAIVQEAREVENIQAYK